MMGKVVIAMSHCIEHTPTTPDASNAPEVPSYPHASHASAAASSSIAASTTKASTSPCCRYLPISIANGRLLRGVWRSITVQIRPSYVHLVEAK